METIKIPLGELPESPLLFNQPQLETICKNYLMIREQVTQKEVIAICDKEEATYKTIIHWRIKGERQQKSFYFVNWIY